MEIYSEILGNLHDPAWAEKIKAADVELLPLDQWTAQKSRFVAKSDKGNERAVALKRQTRLIDGDILAYDPKAGTALAVKLDLSPVLVIDLSKLEGKDPETIISRSVELGHALGNQHWPAVVKGTLVFVPLTVDRKVMISVMETHGLEDISYEFRPGGEVIPYMAPHEIRRLFGGASGHSHGLEEHHHDHDHCSHDHHDHCGHEHAAEPYN